jgi:hypothetical protein
MEPLGTSRDQRPFGTIARRPNERLGGWIAHLSLGGHAPREPPPKLIEKRHFSG